MLASCVSLYRIMYEMRYFPEGYHNLCQLVFAAHYDVTLGGTSLLGGLNVTRMLVVVPQADQKLKY